MKELSEELIEKFILGTCSEEELQQINSIIKDSKQEAYRLFHAEELYHLGKIERYAGEQRMANAQKRLHRRLEVEKKVASHNWFTPRIVKYAAAVVSVLALGYLAQYYYRSLPDADMLMAVATDEVKMVTLPDSTKVWLNKMASLKYPSNFSGKERNVFLDGEAYFEVSKNPQKPFVVKNEVMQVRVLGTKFDLYNDKSSPIAKATLLEGQIEVTGKEHDGKVVLCPGQRAELDKSSGLLTVKQVDAKMDAVWRDNYIPFHKANIIEIAKKLEEYYQVKIIVSSDVELNRTYSGILKKKDNIRAVLKSLQNSVPVNYEITNKGIILSSRNE